LFSISPVCTDELEFIVNSFYCSIHATFNFVHLVFFTQHIVKAFIVVVSLLLAVIGILAALFITSRSRGSDVPTTASPKPTAQTTVAQTTIAPAPTSPEPGLFVCLFHLYPPVTRKRRRRYILDESAPAQKFSISFFFNSFFDFLPLNLLLVRNHPVKIIIVKRLIQGCNIFYWKK